MYSVLDLFAGAGGFSLGFESAGFRTAAAVDIDQWACATLKHNFPRTLVAQYDLSSISDEAIESFGKVDVLIGGPPCQGFSVAGPSQFGVTDSRNQLFTSFLRFARILRPAICVIENVPGIASRSAGDGGTVPEVVRATLAPSGYSITTLQLNAVEFGVPQSRRRLFILATQKGITIPTAPPPSHAPTGDTPRMDLFTRLLPPVTVWDAISDLPQIDAGKGTDDLVPYPGEVKNSYQELMRTGSAGVRNHIAMRHTTRLLERFRAIPAGHSLKDAPSEYGQRRNRSGTTNDKPYKYNNYRLAADLPALAIAASFQSSFIHPFIHRNLTAREAARLMSFPDTFVFQGKRTTMSWEKCLSQYNQIGNAVCPLVARVIAQSCREVLVEAEVYPVHRSPCRLHDSLCCWHPLPQRLATGNILEQHHDVWSRLNEIGRHLLGSRVGNLVSNGIRVEGFTLPLALVPLAILCSTESQCRLCDQQKAPRGRHAGTIPFLISKDGTDTLFVRGKDHGLDFHLRVLAGIDHQCAHFVGQVLHQVGLGIACDVVNPRTGRRVSGLVIESCPDQVESCRGLIRELISRQTGQTTS